MSGQDEKPRTMPSLKLMQKSWNRLKNEVQAWWLVLRLRFLLRKVVRTIPKTMGDSEDFLQILKIWEKQLTIATSDRPDYWKRTVQKELQQEFDRRYRSLMAKLEVPEEEGGGH